MAGVDTIIERIMLDAQEQAESNRSAARQKAEAILAEGRDCTAKKVQAMQDSAKADAANLIKRHAAVAGLELRKEELAMKRAMLEDAFVKAENAVANVSDEEYDALMADLLAECANAGDGEVLIAGRDKRLLPAKFVGMAQKKLRDKGVETRVKQGAVDERLENGFIYTADGMEINCSISEVIRQRKGELESEVYAILFD